VNVAVHFIRVRNSLILYQAAHGDDPNLSALLKRISVEALKT